MLRTEEQSDVLGSPLDAGDESVLGAPGATGELLVGDLGSIVLRGLLECGVGYVVSSWLDRPTPIDSAIDDARTTLLERHGIVVRRLRALSALEPLLREPTGGLTREAARGVVVFSGRRGMRPALEAFTAFEVRGGVVGFCFDDDAVRIEDALVIDPEPTPAGLLRAMDAGFAASVASGRPALILVRERSLGMRGTVRCRPDAGGG